MNFRFDKKSHPIKVALNLWLFIDHSYIFAFHLDQDDNYMGRMEDMLHLLL